MNTPSPSTPLQNRPIPVQAKNVAAWTSFMFLYIYVDYYHLHKPEVIDNLRAGQVFEFAVSPALMTGFLVVTGIPTMMVVLSAVLPARVNRITNLVAAVVYIPVTVFNAVGETWEWASFYALSIGLELLLLAFILRSAWAWPREVAPATAMDAPAHAGHR